MDSQKVEVSQVESTQSTWKIKVFKSEAKALLKGRWKVPVLLSLIMLGFTLVTVGIFYPWEILFSSNIMSGNLGFFYGRIFLYLIACCTILPVLYYVSIFFYNQVKEKKEEMIFSSFFRGFTYWKQGLLGNLWQFLWIFLWEMLYLIIFIVVGILIVFLINNIINDSNQLFTSLVLFLGEFIVFGFIARKYYSYSLQINILAENPNIGVKKSLNISKEITKGYKGKLFVLDLSFFGWYFLSILSLGIGLLWLAPYWVVTKINAYSFIKEEAIVKGILKEETSTEVANNQ